MRARNIVIMLGIILLVGFTVYQHTSASRQEAMLPQEVGPWKDMLAPTFSLHNMEGDEVYEVGGERDKALFVNFWASWCGPCELEAPDLVRLHDKYQNNLEIYAVNATALDSARDAEQFVQRHGFDFPVLMDVQADAVKLYNVLGYPTSFLIDKHGVIRDVIHGVLPYDELEKRVKRLIKY